MSRCPVCRRELRGPSHACLGPSLADPDETSAPISRARVVEDLGPISDDLPAGTLVNGYLVHEKLGAGGMSVVYRATHARIGKQAAIKVLSVRGSIGANERFAQEARAVNQIAHPNIVDVFELGVLPDGRHFLIMELLKGETLGARLARQPVPLAIFEPICRALEAAHAQGIVHRDLKPDNVFLVSTHGQEHVKLIDFGVAKLLQSDTRLERTDMGDVIGTPKYLSPEQARTLPHIDHRADIYSLGVMLYQVLAGRLPFEGTREELLQMHMTHPAPPVRIFRPTIPEALESLLMRMLAKDPADRPSLSEIRKVIS